MDVTDIIPHLDQLDADIDQLEEVLQPLLRNLGEVSSQLPLLDKAKLNVLASYTIESLIFSALRLSGVDAKGHGVFTELTRVRQYFDKIKKIESPPEPRNKSVNTQAAIRFLRADLADNAEVKTKLAEQLSKERAKAATKAGKKRPAEESPSKETSVSSKSKGGEQKHESLAKRPKHGRSKGKP